MENESYQSILADIADKEEEIGRRFYDDVWFNIELFSFELPVSIVENKPKEKIENIAATQQQIKEKVMRMMKLTLPSIEKFDRILFNNKMVWKELVWDINGYLGQLKEQNKIADYSVACDKFNNPPQIFQEGKLMVDVFIKWTHDSEFQRMTFLAGE